jgi:lysine 2,3-aminomutase
VHAELVEPAPALAAVAARYAVALTPHVVDQIEAGSGALARQFLPTAAELQLRPEERADPIGDAVHEAVPGVVHRYPDRVLLKPVHVCPVYCRFCFRREQVGPQGAVLRAEELDRALDWIAGNTDIWEVILTGGDPLVMAPAALGRILGRLAEIPHVQVVRVHTRVPVVEPGRVNSSLIDALAGFVPVWIAVHSNHADELAAPGVAEALDRLARAGHPLVGQTVLLAGVNDTVPALTELFRAMVRHRIKPYYLHQGDLAPGTGHFRVPLERGQALMAALRGDISGLCLPTYVLDLPGGFGKVPVGPQYVEGRGEDGRWAVRDPWGTVHGVEGQD